MHKTRTAYLTVLLILYLSSAAFADILDIKGKGAASGKIISESDKEVVFKDVHGDTLHVPRKDVEMLIKEDAALPKLKLPTFGKPDKKPAPAAVAKSAPKSEAEMKTVYGKDKARAIAARDAADHSKTESF